MRTLLDRKNISSRTNGQVAARRVTGLLSKGFGWHQVRRDSYRRYCQRVAVCCVTVAGRMAKTPRGEGQRRGGERRQDPGSYRGRGGYRGPE